MWIWALLLGSCQQGTGDSPSAGKAKIEIEDQGVHINYTDSKIGDTTLLFVHGWAINQTYWSDQASFFSQKYRVVTMDLPGFGHSGKNRTSWTVQDYARDIASVVKALQLRNVILIGHSMSGAIVVQTALDSPAMIRGIIGIDNFKDFGTEETPKSKEEKEEFFRKARAHFWESVSSLANKILFSSSTDSTVRNRVLRDIHQVDTTIALDCLEHAGISHEKVISLKRPIYLINSDYTPTDTAAFLKNNIEYHLLTMHGTGHFPMIEKPAEFNLLLEQAISMILSGRTK